jgi:hypothetical protein
MPQMIALASTRFTCPGFENLSESSIRIVLEALSQVLQLPIAGPWLVDQARGHRMIEKLFDHEPVAPRNPAGRSGPGPA